MRPAAPRPRVAAVVLAACAALVPATPAASLVAAAASVREVVREAADALAPSGARYEMHTGGSAALARQIDRGAPVAVFVSAATEELTALERDLLLVPRTRVTLAANRLVVVVPPGATPPVALADLADARFRTIALANPGTAPAGRYARQALAAAGVWPALADRIVRGEHVRHVVEYVASGNADAGIVYASDVARFAGRLTPGPAVPEDLHAPIRIEGALVRGAEDDDDARALLDWLASDAGRAAFVRHGFAPP